MADLARCPLCNSEAAEIDRGLFDGVGFDCRFHGRFRVSGTGSCSEEGAHPRQWEHAVMLATACFGARLASAMAATLQAIAPAFMVPSDQVLRCLKSVKGTLAQLRSQKEKA
jgi:hypothetical protein